MICRQGRSLLRERDVKEPAEYGLGTRRPASGQWKRVTGQLIYSFGFCNLGVRKTLMPMPMPMPCRAHDSQPCLPLAS